MPKMWKYLQNWPQNFTKNPKKSPKKVLRFFVFMAKMKSVEPTK